jgi:hypothetical protein
MRDIELIHVPGIGPPAEPVDNAYVRASPGGVLSTSTATDPAFTDTKAYGAPSLGGEFGPGRALLLSGPADGGQAALDAAITIIVTPPVVPTAPVVWPGRAANNSSFLNLYPWHKTPPQGLDQNNPNPPPSMLAADEPEPAVEVPAASKPAAKAKK